MRSILFDIGPIPIRAYGTMMIIGFVLGLLYATRVAKARKMDPDRVTDTALIALIAGIIGARVVYLALSWSANDYTFADIYRVWEGGLSFHGGLLFAIIAVALYLKRAKIPFLVMADILAPATAIGYAFTRIGCFLNGCCYGHETHLPWAVSFHDASLGAITPPSHPAQLYAFAANIVIFAILAMLQKQNRKSGFVFISYLALYSIYRFLVEIVRKGATAEVIFAGLTEAQIASIILFAISGLILLIVYRSKTINASAL